MCLFILIYSGNTHAHIINNSAAEVLSGAKLQFLFTNKLVETSWSLLLFFFNDSCSALKTPP